MFFINFIQQILNSQWWTLPLIGLPGNCQFLQYFGVVCDCAAQQAICPATAFTKVGAAFATQGYWVQADLLDYLTFQVPGNTDFGNWAILVYVCAAAGGLVSMAMGQPPRNYLWFFIGPAVYNWLVDTRQGVTGVQWAVGLENQDQRQVWRIAEVGLLNTSLYRRNNGNIEVHATAAPRRSSGVSGASPAEIAFVSSAFLWFDELMSSAVAWMVNWSGVGNQSASNPDGDTNIFDAAGGLSQPDDRWYLLSDLKWGILENITSAKLASPDVRDTFITMMASECGDKIADAIYEPAFIAASQGKGRKVPLTIFKTEPGFTASYSNNPIYNDYNLLKDKLRTTYVPTPKSLKRVLDSTGMGSFVSSVAWDATSLEDLRTTERIRCDTLLDVSILMFRWEAGHITHQLVQSAPSVAKIAYNGNQNQNPGPDERGKVLVHNLFYGWDIRINRDPMGSNPGAVPNGDTAMRFLQDLILVHLFKNEIAIAPQPVDMRFASSTRSKNYVEAYQRTLGSKSKYGELYAWALMIPYIQGVLLYFLAISYPFACLATIMPGFHKTVFTWASFWAWAKLWDVGFALVRSLERSVWAMMGNSSSASGVHDYIAQMQMWGHSTSTIQTSCNGLASNECPVPFVELHGPSGSPLIPNIGNYDLNLRILDRAWSLGVNLDLDLANAYYIYIMSALYFAVPAVTGQVVLGAKAGASSIVGNAVGGISQESGKMAGQGFSGDIVQRMKSAQNAVGQESYAKSLRQSGLAHQALDAGNRAELMGMEGSAQQALSSGIGLKKDQISGSRQVNAAGAKFAGSAVQATLPFAMQWGGNRIAGGAGVPVGSGAAPTGNGTATDSAIRAGMMNEEPGVNGVGDTLTNDPKSPGIGPNLHTPTNMDTPSVSGLTGGMADFGAAGGGRQVRGGGGLDRLADFMRGENGGKLAKNMAELASSSAEYEVTAGALGDISNLNKEAASANLSSFDNGAQSRGYGQHSGRLQQQADFAAQEDSWAAKNQYANQMGSQSSIVGLFAGGLDPGAKPTSYMGMAMDGMLDSKHGSAKDKANFFNPQGGAYFGAVANRNRQLNNEVGSGAVGGLYQVKNPAQVFGQGFTNVAGNLAMDDRNGNQIYNQTSKGTNPTLSKGDQGRRWAAFIPIASENSPGANNYAGSIPGSRIQNTSNLMDGGRNATLQSNEVRSGRNLDATSKQRSIY